MTELLREIDSARDTAALAGVIARQGQWLSESPVLQNVVQGFAALRRAAITGAPQAIDSASAAFRRALDLDDTIAPAHLGRGLTLLRDPGVRRSLVATGRSWSTILGFDARARARRSFVRALELDPALAGAAVALGEVALQTQDAAELVSARDALARTLSAGTADAPVLAMLVRVASAIGDSATAEGVIAQLAPADAGPETLHSILWALAGKAGGETDVADTYQRMIESADPALIDGLYLEVHPILSSKEIEAWRSGNTQSRRELLRGMWDARAALSATTEAERIAEHWGRLGSAVRRFGRRSDGPPPPRALTQARLDSPFDDRGVVWVRHGEPIDVIITPGSLSACPRGNTAFQGNESWLYREPDGAWIMYHFARCFDFPDFVLLDTIPCGSQWVAERAGYDPGLRACGPMTLERLRKQARAAITSDSHRPRLERQVPVVFDLLAFRGIDGSTDLLLPIAVEGTELTGREIDGQWVYGIDLTAAVVDTASGAVVRRDTTVLGRYSRELGSMEFLRTHVQLEARPTANAEFRLAVRGRFDNAEGGFYGKTISIPDYGGDTLQVSSIVLALPDTGGSWRRGGHSLGLSPVGVFEGGAFRVFYEIYNLKADSTYVTAMTVEPTGGQGPKPLRLEYRDLARPDPDGVVREDRAVESGLPAGRYRVTIEVTDPQAGRSARAEREFVVTRRQEG